jgi:hypothetical protein
MMAYENGRLPASALRAIAGGGRLAAGPAAAWNAMDAMCHSRWGRGLHANDSYRPLGAPGDLYRGVWSQWAAWERYQQGGNLAARPGTSNHGTGSAADVDQWSRWAIDQIGAQFGWAKNWSDAPSEWWHLRWRVGIWPPSFANVRRGDKGQRVLFVQARLYIHGYTVRVDGDYGAGTSSAVARFKAQHKLADRNGDRVGDVAWRALSAAPS